jgi:hypothetical protein
MRVFSVQRAHSCLNFVLNPTPAFEEISLITIFLSRTASVHLICRISHRCGTSVKTVPIGLLAWDIIIVALKRKGTA